MENIVGNINKIINRGILYTLKIEVYKIFFDQKYENTRKKKLLVLILKLVLKTKMKQPKFIQQILDGTYESYSQICQDIFVLSVLDNKKNGFFVEIGAGDGINFSNTYLLEKNYGWNGILVEPSKTFYNKCIISRKCTVVNKVLLDKHYKKVKFYEKKSGEFSHTEGFGDILASEIKSEYYVEVVEFDHLFANFSKIPKIDFLSIDTEGSEQVILSSIDFFKFNPSVICIEHNYRKDNRLYYKNFLQSKGYKLVYTGISRWDSWFILDK
jgi:FkbM family methyltransferase